MKAVILSLCCMLFVQLGSAQNVFLGLTGSAGSSKFVYSEDFQDTTLQNLRKAYSLSTEYVTKGSFAYSIGGTIGLNISESVDVFVRATFARNTYEYEPSELLPYPGIEDPGIYRYEKQLTFINLDPILRIKPFDLYGGPYVQIGPSFSLGLAGKEKGYFDPGVDDPILLGEIRDVEFGDGPFENYRSLFIGLNLGIGWAFYINDDVQLTTELQHRRGFSNMYSDSRIEFLDGSISGTQWLRSTSFSVGVEYSLNTEK